MISLELPAIIFGISAAILWGAADFVGAKASRRNKPEIAALWVSIIGTIIYTCIYLISPGVKEWNQVGISYAVIAGIFLEAGLYMLYRGLTVGKVSIVSPISSAYPLITAILLVAFFNEILTGIDMIGIIIIVFGIAISSTDTADNKYHSNRKSGIIYAIFTVLLWGMAYAMLAQAVNSIGWEKAVLVDLSSGLIALILTLLATNSRVFLKSFKFRYAKDRAILGAALLQLLGGIVFTYGLTQVQSSAVITAISATYPAFAVLLALKFFDEKKQIIPLLGAFITILGVIILTVH